MLIVKSLAVGVGILASLHAAAGVMVSSQAYDTPGMEGYRTYDLSLQSTSGTFISLVIDPAVGGGVTGPLHQAPGFLGSPSQVFDGGLDPGNLADSRFLLTPGEGNLSFNDSESSSSLSAVFGRFGTHLDYTLTETPFLRLVTNAPEQVRVLGSVGVSSSPTQRAIFDVDFNLLDVARAGGPVPVVYTALPEPPAIPEPPVLPVTPLETLLQMGLTNGQLSGAVGLQIAETQIDVLSSVETPVLEPPTLTHETISSVGTEAPLSGLARALRDALLTLEKMAIEPLVWNSQWENALELSIGFDQSSIWNFVLPGNEGDGVNVQEGNVLRLDEPLFSFEPDPDTAMGFEVDTYVTSWQINGQPPMDWELGDTYFTNAFNPDAYSVVYDGDAFYDGTLQFEVFPASYRTFAFDAFEASSLEGDASPVPEPAAGMLAGVGLLALGVRWGRR